MVNISNRGFVSTGFGVMIPGFVVSNDGPKTFLVRAAGPTLIPFGVGTVLADPVLTVYERTGTGDVPILVNDNWGDSPDADNTRATAAALGAFAFDEGGLDAAFVITLPPGVYTAVCTGAGGGTGNALVEVYLVTP
jgi:hypothetical protein